VKQRSTRGILSRIITISVALTAVLVGMSLVAAAADKSAVQKKLESEYALTKTTDDKTDIVTAGAVLVLQKDKVLMVAATSNANPCMNTYKDGKIAQNAGCKVGDKLRRIPGFGSHVPGADKAPATRNFVTGEKFWLTKIEVKDAGIFMDFFTDAISDVRYKGILTIPFNNGVPSPDDAVKLAQEVITVAPSEDAKGDAKQAPVQGGQQQASAGAAPAAPSAPAPAAAAEAAPPAIEPPPPPAEEAAPPPTVALGQTPEEVVAALGQPQKKAKVGTKEIYFYKDLKVSFVNGKVKDIQ
jgi:hypothetical protein